METARILSLKPRPNRFSAKILLFGEYTLITGSRGLAVPYSAFQAKFQQAETVDAIESAFRLDSFYHYLKGSKILSDSMDLDRFESDLKDGFFLQSDIPRGYGIGSSGTLCAAVYARYAHDFERKTNYSQDELHALKDQMALMENFYHGTSSGLDCLISLIGQSVLVKDRNYYETIEAPNLDALGSFYLCDSGINRKTASFVHGFLQQYETDSAYKSKVDEHGKLVNDCINNIITADKEAFQENLYKLSHFQYLHFANMIPDSIKEQWMVGLETKDYILKLCGAGGGGYFLAYRSNAIGDIPSNFMRIDQAALS